MEKRVLFFTSQTCFPCSRVKPILLQLQEQYKFKVTLHELSRENIEPFETYGVRMVPTLILINEDTGKGIGRHSGQADKMMLERLLKEWGLIK